MFVWCGIVAEMIKYLCNAPHPNSPNSSLFTNHRRYGDSIQWLGLSINDLCFIAIVFPSNCANFTLDSVALILSNFPNWRILTLHFNRLKYCSFDSSKQFSFSISLSPLPLPEPKLNLVTSIVSAALGTTTCLNPNSIVPSFVWLWKELKTI